MKVNLTSAAIHAVLPITAILLVSLAVFYGTPTTNAQGDTTAPTVSSITITSDPDTRNDGLYEVAGGQDGRWPRGWYGIGDEVTITVTFSENIIVTGTPTIQLTVGTTNKSASFQTVDAAEATFAYTVAEGDSDTNGLSIPRNQISLAGGTIKDSNDNDAVLSNTGMARATSHKVDGIRPRIRDLEVIELWRSGYRQDQVFIIGQEAFVKASFTERVYGSIAGPPLLNLNMDGTLHGAEWEVTSFPGYPLFNYFIQEGDWDADGIAIPANAADMNGGFIKDGAGNDLVLENSAVTSTWKVDGIKPTVSSIAITSDPGDDQTYGVGDDIEITVTFSERVWVLGNNTIQIRIGGTERSAESETQLTASNDVVFTYTVVANDNDSDGIDIEANKLTADRGWISDAISASPGGNDADLKHSAVSPNIAHKVDTAGNSPTPTPTPQNNPATGQPSITGTAQATVTLTAGTSGISDTDGLSNSIFGYQWVRNNGDADTEITGATNSTYTLTNTDVGSTIKVKVTFTDDAGHSEALTSNATDTVVTAPNNPAIGAPTITGTTRVAQTLTAVTTGISDQDGLTQATYSYQWIRSDGTSDSDVSGATNATYVLTNVDLGKTIKVQVSFTDDNGNHEVVTSNATATITAAVNNPATGLPTITGTPQVEQTLTAVTTGIADQDGLTQVAYSYQWVRNDSTDDADIAGATSAAYLLTAADESKFIKVRVSFNDDAQNAETLTSAATTAVAAPDTFLTGLTISPGTLTPAFSGSTINYTVPDVANTNDEITLVTTLEEGHTPILVRAISAHRVCSIYGEPCEPWTYRDENNSQVQPISDADTDVDGFQVTVDVGDNKLIIHVPSGSSEDDEFYYLTITRAEEEERNVVPRRIPSNNSPATGLPTISGTAAVGQTLTASTSDIDDADGIENVTFSYQWTRYENDADSDIADATGSTYTIATADEGKTLKVQVSFTDDAEHSESRVSASTQSVTAASNRPATGTPTISGTPERTHTLTASTAAISDPDGLTNATFAYQWLRDADNDPADISGATSSTYTLVADDVGNKISVRVSYTDDAGNSESMTSATVNALEPPPLLGAFDADTVSASHDGETEITFEIYFSVEPSLGFVNVRDHVLTVSNGDVTAVRRVNPQSSTPNSRWEITVEPNDDDDITVVLPQTTDCTANSAVCTSTGITLSNRTSITVPGPVNTAATGEPTISGATTVGSTLIASTSAIADTNGLTNANFSYQWLRSNVAISDATGSSYILAAADQGNTIKVRVSFTDDASNAETLTSAATAAVSAAPPTNAAASGAPVITGTAQVGQTLTAGTSGITDANGLDNATFAYQWIRVSTAISGATSSTYTIAGEDEGHSIKVRVSFTDDDGFSESVTSPGLYIPVVPLRGFFDEDTVPASHSGINTTFTFELYFSVEPTLGFVNVRDHVLTLANGDVTAVRRTSPQSSNKNSRWEITVEPAGDSAVTVAFSPTTDCATDSAVCTSYGKMMSNSGSITVAGP